MFSTLAASARAFARNPLNFILQTFYCGVFNVVAVFAGLGLFLFLLYFALLISVPMSPTVLGMLLIPALFVFLLVSSGFQGSLARSYSSALKGVCIHFSDFFEFAVKRSFSFFGLFITFLFFSSLSMIPFAVTHFVLEDSFPSLSVLKTLSLVASAFGILFSIVLVFPMLVSMGAFNANFKSALGHSIKLAKSQHILALIMCVLIVISGLLIVVPFANILSILVFLPVLYGAYILSYQRTVFGTTSVYQEPQPSSRPAVAPVPSKRPSQPAPSRRKFGRKHEGLI